MRKHIQNYLITNEVSYQGNYEVFEEFEKGKYSIRFTGTYEECKQYINKILKNK